MGQSKRLMEEEETKGFYTPPGKHVCKNCFGDYAIRDFISSEAIRKVCDYCGKKNKKTPIAARLEDVLEFMMEGINSEWEDPLDCVGWMSSEGGWIGAEVIDSYDLISERLDLGIGNNDLFHDILHTIIDRQWCKLDPYAPSSHEKWSHSWEAFSHQVKYRSRYMFFKLPEEKPVSNFEKQSAPYEILFTLGNMVNEFGLIRTIDPGTLFVRARSHSKGAHYTTLKDLGPPPEEKTISNRMSPAGIVMFYGALDKNTAISEIQDKSDLSKTHVTTARFKNIRSFNVLDLTKLPSIPSLFDAARRDNRSSIIFLRSFRFDISKPIQKDNRVHIEYVPTQIVTEYFRLIFRDGKRKPIKGIIYPSSQLSGGKSCVLFFTSANCTTDSCAKGGEIWLSLQSSSIKTRKFR